MRHVVLAVSLLATSAHAAPPAPQGSVAGKQLLIGFVTEQGTGVCGKGHEVTWTDLHPEIGWAIAENGGADVSPFKGSMVIAYGTVKEATRNLALKAGHSPCGMEQMRSDWVSGKSGIRVVRRSAPVGKLAVERAVRWKGLTVSKTGEGTFTAVVTNDLKQFLPDAGRLEKLELVVYYEGTRGKPGTVAQSFLLGDLEPGKSATTTFPEAIYPASAPKPGKNQEPEYLASTVSLGAASGAAFDLDVPLSAFEAK
jgi:hypothetical protein